MYHNTNNLTGGDLHKAQSQCESQDNKILNFLKKHTFRMFTPFEIHSAIFDSNTPITSVRRSLSNLTKSGLLEKCEMQKHERYGKPNYYWRIKVNKIENI